ncbi:type VI secretion system tip protein TssI/VgrG [Escherichia coli]|uniref:type VI secretion system tip protein TssI/VgrG n=1 Tax=Escherichia coli TaxID=562 RepID=UPI000DA47F22|nr:type VI secretion system tip protein TssI/VgrG [Escherichia coli]SQP22908.1 ImpA family type VI secretion-associated protein [Escherichia coli]
MSGKPAARQGDMTQYGGPIVQGSAGVRIGAPTGVACSVCPGGMTSGNPVNPLLGAKVLPGETDLALPGPLPFILSRTYSSYRTKTPAPVGVFGPGWKAPSDIRLQLRDDGLILNDNGGRSIHFEPLLPGEAVYSRSESMWLVRGGKAAQPDGHTLARLWGALPPDIRLSPHLYLATNSAQGPWWILGWSELVPGAEDVLPAPLPPYRVLTGLADRFGRTLTYRREAAGDLAGEITGVTDGAGREFRLVLTTQAQRAEEARKQRTASLSSPDTPRPLSASAFPDTLPGTEYGPDRGIRLSAVWLVDGPQSAVVTGPAGEEIFCDEHGRVRVKFNWDRYNPSNQDSSCWIRVAQAWAGTGFGNLAIPRVGQEVIVDFLNGDPDQPIIMGRTYHQENRTPGSLPGTKTQMTIRSKTYKGSGFNELKFDDATGKEQVYIHAQKNMNTEVLNNRTTDVINNHAEKIGNNQAITVTNNQIQNIGVNQIQTVGVNQVETVGSNQIIKVGSNQVEKVGIIRALTVGVAYQTTVGGIMNTSVALLQSSQVGLHKSLMVGMGYSVNVGNNVTFSVGKTMKENTGQTAVYSAGEHLELCCGKARLVLTKDGSIFLNGTHIHLEGESDVNGDAPVINWNCGATQPVPDAPVPKDLPPGMPDMRQF